MENKLVDFVLVLGHSLGHRDFAAGFVVDLRTRKARDKTVLSGRQPGTKTHFLLRVYCVCLGKAMWGRKEKKAERERETQH